LGVFGFEDFRLAFVVAIFQSSFSRKSSGGDITAKYRFKPTHLRNSYREGVALHADLDSDAAVSNQKPRPLLCAGWLQNRLYFGALLLRCKIHALT
jgi:hypothetical protein